MKNNNSNVRKRDVSPLLIIILGIVFGGALMGVGIFNHFNSDYDAMNIMSEEEAKTNRDDKMKIYNELIEKRQEEYNKSALSDEYNKLSREISVAEGELLDAEAEYQNVTSGFYDSTKNEKFINSIPLIVLGALVIVISLGIAMKKNTSNSGKILTVSEEK